MFHLAPLAAIAAIAAIAVVLDVPTGSASAQEFDVEQEENGLRPPERVPRYREARPDEPGLRYRRVEPEAGTPRPADPAPRYGQDELDEPGTRYGRAQPQSITTDEALRIARGEGLARVDGIRESRRGWVVTGMDRNGDDMRIVIGRSGEVADIEQ